LPILLADRTNWPRFFGRLPSVRRTSASDEGHYVNFHGSSYVDFTTGWNKNGEFTQPFISQAAWGCCMMEMWRQMGPGLSDDAG